jgi:hypothetical protein
VVVNIHVVGKTNDLRESGVRGAAASVMTNEIITKPLVSFPQEIPKDVVHKTQISEIEGNVRLYVILYISETASRCRHSPVRSTPLSLRT